MEFSEAVRTVLTERYADFSGRAQRSEYWWFVLFYFLVALAVGAIGAISETLGGILNVVVTLGLLIPSIAVAVRRFHDMDRSGWWVLLVLIPVIGTIVLLIWFTQRGTDGPNRFGPDPLGGVSEGYG